MGARIPATGVARTTGTPLWSMGCGEDEDVMFTATWVPWPARDIQGCPCVESLGPGKECFGELSPVRVTDTMIDGYFGTMCFGSLFDASDVSMPTYVVSLVIPPSLGGLWWFLCFKWGLASARAAGFAIIVEVIEGTVGTNAS